MLPPTLMIVTGSVDRITVLEQMGMDHNAQIEGQVVWVGRSSLDVRVRVMVLERIFIEAHFVMVVLDKTTGKPVTLPPLELVTAEDILAFSRADAGAARRNRERTQSLRSTDPLPTEVR